MEERLGRRSSLQGWGDCEYAVEERMDAYPSEADHRGSTVLTLPGARCSAGL